MLSFHKHFLACVAFLSCGTGGVSDVKNVPTTRWTEALAAALASCDALELPELTQLIRDVLDNYAFVEKLRELVDNAVHVVSEHRGDQVVTEQQIRCAIDLGLTLTSVDRTPVDQCLAELNHLLGKVLQGVALPHKETIASAVRARLIRGLVQGH